MERRKVLDQKEPNRIMVIKEIFSLVLESYQENANPDLAIGMKAYLKNKFEHFGIKTPVRREICKPILAACKTLSKVETIELAKELWKQPYRDCHYFAQELLWQNLKKKLEKDDIVWMEWLVTTNSWWDTVDFIAPKLMAKYFEQFPEERKLKTDQWIASKNIWLVRSALLFQLKYKKETDLNLLFNIILRVNSTKEFFINKAIGWMLRENAKRIPEVIYDFIREHRHELSGLSIREGLKHSTTHQLEL